MDLDHTLAIYDCQSGEPLFSGKSLVSPNAVNGMAYSPNDSEICIVGRKKVLFFSGLKTSKRALESRVGRIGRIGRKITFYCVTYFGDDVVVGCASGELYRFRDCECIQIVQAHSIREPILCIYANISDGLLVTGGNDCLVRTWDSSLKEVGAALDVSTGLDAVTMTDSKKSSNSSIVSVQLLDGHLLIGTKGGELFEASVQGIAIDLQRLQRIGWSHSHNFLWGLATHPNRDEFSTCGSDNTLRVWSIRSKEQIAIRSLPNTGRVLAYSPKGELMAVGLEDGTIGE